jgi:hypothetical protein
MLCYNGVHVQIKDEIDELHREAREGWCDFDKVTHHFIDIHIVLLLQLVYYAMCLGAQMTNSQHLCLCK